MLFQPHSNQFIPGIMPQFRRGRDAGGGGTTPDILWWKFNDGSGTAINADVGGDGTTNGSWQTGASGSGYSLGFDGSSDYAQSDASVTYGSPSITVCAWVYASDWNAAGENVIWESGPNYGSGPIRFILNFQANSINAMIYQSGAGKIDSFTAPAESLSANTWYHFAVVYENDANSGAGAIEVYVDGAVVTTTEFSAKSGTGNFAAETLNLGARNAAGSWFGGRIDDLRIFGSALDATTIADIYAEGGA